MSERFRRAFQLRRVPDDGVVYTMREFEIVDGKDGFVRGQKLVVDGVGEVGPCPGKDRTYVDDDGDEFVSDDPNAPTLK